MGLLNQKGILAASFDSIALAGVVYDARHRLFKEGEAPSFFQIKCRGSNGGEFHPQGHGEAVFQAMRQMAHELAIPRASLYFGVGFFKDADIRTLVFFGIPLAKVSRFKSGTEFRFSVAACRRELQATNTIFEI